MADTIVDAVELLRADSASPNSKRKRDLGDSPDDRRKRSVTSTGILATDAPNLSFIESAVEAAAAASNTNMANAATVAALSALQQATQASEASDQASVTVTVDHTHTPHTHTHTSLPHTPHAHQHAHTHQPQPPHTHTDTSADPSDPANASSTAAAALGTMYPTMHVPTPTEQQFVQAPASASDLAVTAAAPQSVTVAVSAPPPPSQPTHEQAYTDVTVPHVDHATLALVGRGQTDLSMQHRKPAVGTPEWHKQRKDNHKEVERRRRETINEGINELAKIVPQCEKNKGSILQKAVQFIQQLKANEASNIEKWTLEKLLTEQAIGELSQSNEKLKAECERLYRELETYKRLCQSAGVEMPNKQQDAAVPTTTA